MPLHISGKNSGTDFQPHPAGPYPARCTRIIDLGSQPKTFKGQTKLVHQIMVSFQSSELMPDGDMAGKPFLVTAKYTASLGEKSLLRRDLESWRGRPFTKQELDNFDIEAVLGKAALLQIVHSDPAKSRDGKVYANIKTIMTLPSSMTAPVATEPPIFFSFESFDVSVLNKLSDKLQEQIKSSPEYRDLMSGKPLGDRSMANHGTADDDDGEDIPF